MMYMNDRYKEHCKQQENKAKYDKILINNFYLHKNIAHRKNKVENKIAGCLSDSQGRLAMMFVTNRYKEMGNKI